MQLLQHFKELTIRPKNAQELKGLILQLAIQGKLTANWREQNKNIEPASELLNRIQKEKAQLIKDKKIRKNKSLPNIKKDEFPFKIPNKWIWCRLQDYLDVRDGTHDSPKYIDDGIPLVTSKNLYTKKLDISNVKYISEEDHIEISKRSNVERNDILFAMIGSIGNPVIVDIEPNFSIKNVALIKYYLKDLCLPNFVLFFLEYATKEFKDNSDGAVQSFVSLTKLRAKEFPLPPLEEQKEIVKVVETLFKKVEQLEQLTVARIGLKEDFVTSALNQLTTNNATQEWTFLQEHFKSFFNETTNIKKLRETVLQLAVQGKLTADWRSRHPELVSGSHHASQLLKRIQKEKAQLIKDKKLKKEKALSKITEDEIPYELPEGWVWCRLNELTELITKGSSPKWQGIQYVDEGEGILFVTSENVGNYKLIWKKKKFVESKFNEISTRSILKRNDLLMNIVGGSIGRTAIYNIDELANINQAVTIIRLFPKVSYDYFLHFFNSPICISYMYDKQVDNARPNLSMGNISKFMIPLPPLEEQKAIVEKVNDLMGLCDALEQEVQQSQEHSEMMMQSVLREVFEPNNLN
ncbi:restriction endonuclease subunit S [Cellulophaga sp. Z1A5H]|uniref:restriction endonuclease subunit S n=1 Tax=Cellulophaga sp. Z1A5H TaxID=2687291 RepID=UPI0013FE21B1|nr:restriction endonuclease subunit S [Cellulophaga sp. Z1A5H]